MTALGSVVLLVCGAALALALPRALRPLSPDPASVPLDPDEVVEALLEDIRHHETRTLGRVAMSGVVVTAEWRRAMRMWCVLVDDHVGWVPDTTAVANLVTERLRAIAAERAEVRALRTGVAS